MKFIGRKTELAKLSAEYEHNGSFVVIYGRRRVGKTTLIKEFLKQKTAFYFLATEELETQSMKRLAGVIARTTKNSLLQKVSFSDRRVSLSRQGESGLPIHPAKCLG